MRRTILMVLAAALALGAAAQQPAQPAKKDAKPDMSAMMAKQSPEMKKLLTTFAGYWATEEDIAPNPWMPQGAKGRGMESVGTGPGGNVMISDYRSLSGGMGRFHGHGLMWWDPKAQAYRATWCDNMTPHGCEDGGSGKWEGKDLVFWSESEGPDGKKIKMKQTYTDITPTSFTFRMESPGADGKTMTTMMTLKYKRSAGRGKPAR